MREIKKKGLLAVIGSGMLALAAAGISFASMPDPVQVANTNSHNGVQVTIPSHAVEVAPNVFSLGSAIDPQTAQVVEGYMIVHRKKGEGKDQSSVKAAGKAPSCYGYFAQGAKWKTVEPWLMNTSNTRGLTGSTVFSLMQNGIAKWEDAADGVVGNAVFGNVLGNGSTTSASLVAETSAPDNQNEVFFAPIKDNSNAIAVTIAWGRFSGQAKFRELVEWDMVFDDIKFDWSTSGAPGKMDFDNIVTHELGHAVGLADLYNTCTEETMYGYATEGETKKQTLNPGDIQGMNALY